METANGKTCYLISTLCLRATYSLGIGTDNLRSRKISRVPVTTLSCQVPYMLSLVPSHCTEAARQQAES